MMIDFRLLVLVGIFLPLAFGLSTHSYAQARGTLAGASATNTDYWPDPFPPSIVLAGGSSPQGAPLLAVLEPTFFSGVDSKNAPQTMVFSGTAMASSAYGVLRVSAEGSLTNTFYNEINDPFYRPDKQILNQDGVPDRLSVSAQSQYLDILQWGGELETGYKARYIFRITGNVQGSTLAPFVVFQIEGSSPELWRAPLDLQGPINTIWATQSYPVLGFEPQTGSVLLQAKLQFDTQQVPEGSNVSGSVNLGNTVVLEDIIVTDKNDNVVTGWTLDSQSGTDYLAIDRIHRDRFEANEKTLHLTDSPAALIEQVDHESGRVVFKSR